MPPPYISYSYLDSPELAPSNKPTIVQSVSAASNSQGSVEVTLSPTKPGNLLLVAAEYTNSTAVLNPIVTGGADQAFVPIAKVGPGSGLLQGWYASNCAAGTTKLKVSRGFSGTGQMTVVVTEISNIMEARPLDTTATSTASGATGTSPQTAQAVEFWWAAFLCAGNTAGSPPTITNISAPWTADQNVASSLGGGNLDVCIATAYQIVSKPGTLSATCTDTNASANGTAGFVAAFKGLPVNSFNAVQYANESVSDGDYFIEYGSKYIIQQFNKTWTNNTDNPSVSVSLRSTESTLLSPLYLQIYNQNTSAWETIASQTLVPADTDFTISATQTANISNYYDTANTVLFRIYQKVI